MNRPAAADMRDVFEWNPAYSVNIGSIDAQHRSLLTIGSELYNAMSNGKAGLLRITSWIAWFNMPPRTSRTRSGSCGHTNTRTLRPTRPSTKHWPPRCRSFGPISRRAVQPCRSNCSSQWRTRSSNTSRARTANTRSSPRKSRRLLYIAILVHSGGWIKYGGIDSKQRELCGPRDEQAEGAHALAGPGKGGGNQPVLRQNYSRSRRRADRRVETGERWKPG